MPSKLAIQFFAEGTCFKRFSRIGVIGIIRRLIEEISREVDKFV